MNCQQALISPLSIAPMIDWTYTHYRVFLRLIVPQALLYTEMQTFGAVFHAPEKALFYNPIEQPLALQLGGACPKSLAQAAQWAEARGFVEINLNLGCPSDKVQAGRFGACLMHAPQLAAECIHAMKAVVSIPVTAKVRIGVDKQDSYAFFAEFVEELMQAGCDKLIVHARKAWLQGLSPRQNRTIPPVQYDYVYRIKESLAANPVVINGNINTLDEVKAHMNQVDGVMLGRLACQNPYLLAQIHQHFYPETKPLTRSEILDAYLPYLQTQVSQGAPWSLLLKPLFNFSHGMPYSKRWKLALMQVQQTQDFKELERVRDFLGETVC